MTPWPRSLALRGPRSRPWRLDDTRPLARLRLQAQAPLALRLMTTGPSHSQRPGITARAPIARLPPSRSRMVSVGPHPPEEGTEFDLAHDVLLPAPRNPSPPSPLSVLPLKTVLRTLLISAVSASRPLLSPSLVVLSILATSQNAVLNPDKNPLLRAVLKRVFYAQFCAGETRPEITGTINGLKDLGFSGVILNYAREAVPDESYAPELVIRDESAAEAALLKEVTPWAEGTLETITMAQPGDFVAVKFTGAGRQALFTLASRGPPPPALASAIDSICSLAASRGVRLLFDAEHAAIQEGIDDWTLEYMRKYNRGRVCVYGTYQAYLKSCAATVSEHLRIAQKEGFSLGVKLVRGAYIESDPRHLIHDTKADTDAMYDDIARAVGTRTWEAPVTGSGDFPETALVVASHNAESVRLSRELVERGEAKSEIDFAQLMGMADEVSCTLLPGGAGPRSPGVRAYKYVVWGSMGECMKYLLRRAYENRDAVGRTREGRDAMGRELLRRVRAVFGLN